MKKMNNKAFTLAEVMITLVVLGVIAALTLPSLMRKNNESANVTKVRAVLSNYEKLIENMRLSEGVSTVAELSEKMNTEGCVNSRAYFKIAEDTSDGCIFKTADDLWWNVTNIEKAIVSPDKKGGKTYVKDDTYAKKSADDEDGLKAFFVAVTQGSAAQGNAFIVNSPSNKDVKKTLAFAKIMSSDDGSSGSGDDSSASGPFATAECIAAANGGTCTVGDRTYNKLVIGEDDVTTVCSIDSGYDIDCLSNTPGTYFYTNLGVVANNWEASKSSCPEGTTMAGLADLKATNLYDDAGGIWTADIASTGKPYRMYNGKSNYAAFTTLSYSTVCIGK